LSYYKKFKKLYFASFFISADTEVKPWPTTKDPSWTLPHRNREELQCRVWTWPRSYDGMFLFLYQSFSLFVEFISE